ncbi:hypothetical protein ACRDNQ_04030 [Palleronia sp. KMU-117]|uniref:hypothetical protein n=1 Tax=Palleronia sp. KMU-117 TaxID=3434108 RepID=UPI003D74A407
MITVTLDAVDITDKIVRDSLRITDQLNNRVNRASFSVERVPGDTYLPPLNKEIVITRDSVVIFAGVTVECEERILGHNTVRCDVSCSDYSHYLNRKLVTERYEDTTIGAIIADLLATYAPDFTDNNVVANVGVASVAFNRITISDALQKLAELSNFSWYVDYEKDIHFFAQNGQQAPFALSDTARNHVFESLEIKRDITQLRNTIIIQGGEVPGASRTVKYAGDGDRAEFDTQYKFATKPTVTVDGVAQTVGLDFIDDDGSFDCMWSFQQKYIRFTAGNLPPAPTSPDVTNVDITGQPLYPIVVKVNDPESIAEYGVYEFQIRDENISSQDQAIKRGLGELRAYAGSLNEGSFETYEPGLRAGQTINIQSTLLDVDEPFLIQRVQYRYISENLDLWTVQVASLKTLGIVEIFQKLLTNEELTANEQETLLTYIQLDDTVDVSDAGGLTITGQTGPYLYGSAEWGRATWE